MKVVYQTIFDQMEKAANDAMLLGKTILKFVVNPTEFEEIWPGGKYGNGPKETYYGLIPVEVEK